MTFTSEKLGTVSTVNSFTLEDGVSTAEYNLNSGNVTSATATTIVLGSGSASDDAYNDLVVEIISGTASGQINCIGDYVGATKTATLNEEWKIIPDSTSQYVVHIHSGWGTDQTQILTKKTITLAANASCVNNFYNQAFIKILGGSGNGQLKKIVGYDGTTKLATVDSPWLVFPDATSIHAIFGEGGTCPDQTGASTTEIILDGNQSSIAGTQFLYIEVYSGTGIGQIRQISSISVNTITVSQAWDTQPVQNDKYVIYSGRSGVYENCKDYALATIVAAFGIGAGERGIVDMQLGITSNGSAKRGKYAEASTVFPSTVHTLSIVTEFFRLRVIGMGTKVNGTTQIIFQTSKSGKLTTFVGEQINENNDCEITRAVLVGRTSGGIYKNVTIDNLGDLHVNLNNPLSAFGEVLASTPTPVAQINYTYGIQSTDTELYRSHGTYATVGQDGDGSNPKIQSVYLPGGDLFTTGDYFTLEDGLAAAFYVWYNKDGGGGDPTPGGTGLAVVISSGDSPSVVASATQAVIDARSEFGASVFGSIVTITNVNNGDVASVDLLNMPTMSGSSITTDKGSALAAITNADGVADYAVLRSRRSMRYRPGLGSECRYTAIFNDPTAGTLQLAGMGNSTSALYIGYNGVNFMIMRKSGGLHEIQTLQITGAGSPGDITIVIDGMYFTISIVDASTVQSIAQEINAVDFSSALYLSENIDDSVILSSERSDNNTGLRNFSFDAGSTGITATFTERTQAQSPTDVIFNQYTWNIDRLDGTGPSGMIINPQRGNVYRITFQWLGFGAIIFWVENPLTGKFIPIHNVSYTNQNTLVSLSKPNMQLSFAVASTTSTTPITLKTASGAMFVQGPVVRFDPNFAVSNDHQNRTAAETNAILIAIRNPRIYNDLTSQIEVVLRALNISSAKSGNGTRVVTTFSVVIGGTPSTALPYTYLGNGSATAISQPAAGSTTLSGGTVVFKSGVGAEGSETINLVPINIIVNKSSSVFITYSHPAVINGNVDLEASLMWVEDH
jgi:hypothetical protein